MREPISFSVSGKPAPAGSKRAFVLRKGGAFTGRAIVVDANPKAKDWKMDVRHEAQRVYTGEPWDCPIAMRLVFTVERPQAHYRTGMNAGRLKESAPHFPCSKPDVDKLSRGVLDALTGILYTDDSKIVTKTVTKRYGRPGVIIEMKEEVV